MIGRRSLRTIVSAPVPALAVQGVAVGDGTAGPVEQALAIAFIIALPLTLLAIGLSRGR